MSSPILNLGEKVTTTLNLMEERRHEAMNSPHSEEKDVKAPNLVERAKEEISAIAHTEKSPHHHKETHGTSEDIDENTATDEVKGPNIFQRAKEEIEALVAAVHPKK